MSFDFTDPTTGRITRQFNSQEAFERHETVVATADRVVTDSGKYGSTKWYLKDGCIIGCWGYGYTGNCFERTFEDMADARAQLDALERRWESARAQATVAPPPAPEPPRNASSKIDLGFRPTSYWKHPGRKRANIKGTLRRHIVAEDKALGVTNQEPELLADSISDPMKDVLQRLHPALRGGEDLPDTPRGEVEIARLAYTQTVHCEVTSIRARREGGRIHYRVVDEYETPITCGREWSDEPLTLGELIDLIEDSSDGECREGLFFGDLDWRMANEEGTQARDLEDFIEVSSPFYPEIGKWFGEAVLEWRDNAIAEWGDGDEGDGAEEHDDRGDDGAL